VDVQKDVQAINGGHDGIDNEIKSFGYIYIIECTSHDVTKKCKFKTTLIGFCVIWGKGGYYVNLLKKS
jgi:hypothetical protein